MNSRRLIIQLLVAAAGYAAFIYLVPRLNTSAAWGHELDRGTAIERTRAAAARFGFDAARWDAVVTTQRKKTERLLP